MAETKKNTTNIESMTPKKKASLRDSYCQSAQEYELGSNGKKKSIKMAINSYKKAIEYASVMACVRLGEIYYKGHYEYHKPGIAIDKELAKYYFNLGYDIRMNKFVGFRGDYQAEEGYTYRLGIRFLNGEGVDKDPVKAQELIDKAAFSGSPGAKRYIARQHYYGRGKEKDVKKAASIYHYLAKTNKLYSSPYTTNIVIGEDQWLYALCLYEGYVEDGLGWMYWIKESAKNGYKPAVDYLNKLAAEQKKKAAAQKAKEKAAEELAKKEQLKKATKSVFAKPNPTVSQPTGPAPERYFYFEEAKIWSSQNNPHKHWLTGLIVYDLEYDITFIYKNNKGVVWEIHQGGRVTDTDPGYSFDEYDIKKSYSLSKYLGNFLCKADNPHHSGEYDIEKWL